MLLFCPKNTPHPFDAAPFRWVSVACVTCPLLQTKSQIFPALERAWIWTLWRASQTEGASYSWDVRTRSNFRDYLIDLFFFFSSKKKPIQPFSSKVRPIPFPALFLQLCFSLPAHAINFSSGQRHLGSASTLLSWLTQLRRVEADPRLELGCWLWNHLWFLQGDWSHWDLRPAWSVLSGCSIPGPQKAERLYLSQNGFCTLFLVTICPCFSLWFNLIPRVPFPPFFLSYSMKCMLSGENEAMKCIPIIPFLITGFYVIHSVLIHLTHVYMLTACQPCTGYWWRMDGNHNGTDPIGLLWG